MPVLHRAVRNLTHPKHDDVTTIILHPFAPRHDVVYFDPGPLTMFINNSLDNPRRDENPSGRHTVFGCAQGEVLYLVGFHTDVFRDSHQVSMLRDGGSMMTTRGVPTQAGGETMHFFAVRGDDLLTNAMRGSRKKFMKLSMAQVRYLFRNDFAALRTISPYHARLIATSKIKRSISRRRR